MDRRFAVELLVHHKARPDWDHFVSTDVARFLVQLLLLFGFFYVAPWERFEALRRYLWDEESAEARDYGQVKAEKALQPYACPALGRGRTADELVEAQEREDHMGFELAEEEGRSALPVAGGSEPERRV